MARLGKYAVHLRDAAGEVHSFLPGDEVPAWAAKQMGPHCFAEVADEADAPEDDLADEAADGGEPGDGPPPHAGAGSGRDVWAAYAAANGVEIDDDWKRDQIIDACEEAGVPVE